MNFRHCNDAFAAAAIVGCALAISCSSAAPPADVGAGDASGDAAAVNCKDPSSLGKLCDDSDKCTSGELCSADGVCKGQPTNCNDNLDCTDDSCVAASGCAHKTTADMCAIDGKCVAKGAAKSGDPCKICRPQDAAVAWSAAATGTCDDGDACTSGDVCQKDGNCKGDGAACDDKNPCTVDKCGAKTGCSHEFSTDTCDDADPCTVGDSCDNGKCLPGQKKLGCDDSNPCTADVCVAQKGCKSEVDPAICDDGKACSVDSCDKTSGCKHVDLKPGDKCSVGDQCFVNQTCSADLQCVGGGTKNCDDGNICTTDSCKTKKGCIHQLNKAPCSDGEWCTAPDVCTGGTCIGVKTGSCDSCNNSLSKPGGKLTVFQIGGSGKKGQGIDVDGDPNTCAPSSNCDSGIDNAISVLAKMLNQPMIDSVNAGTLSFVAELAGYQGQGKPFTLNLYYATMSSDSLMASCKQQSDVCEWKINQSSMSPKCKPKFSFENAIVQNGKLTAGGAATLFAMDANLIGAKSGVMFVKGARVEADVEFAADGLTLTSMQGAMGGALPKYEIPDIINAMDASAFGGIDKETVLLLADQLVTSDIDTDGDGEVDACSIGLRFSGIGAKLIGFSSN